jgi:hypothetical protein
MTRIRADSKRDPSGGIQKCISWRFRPEADLQKDGYSVSRVTDQTDTRFDATSPAHRRGLEFKAGVPANVGRGVDRLRPRRPQDFAVQSARRSVGGYSHRGQPESDSLADPEEAPVASAILFASNVVMDSALSCETSGECS